MTVELAAPDTWLTHRPMGWWQPGEPMTVTLGGARFTRFCSRWIKQTKGRWAKQPLNLEPFQVAMFSEMLRTEPGLSLRLSPRQAMTPIPYINRWLDMLDAEPWRVVRGRRVFSEAYVQIAKKNGKSTDAAGLALYFLVADDEEGAEVYSAARDRQQARIVFGQAVEYVKGSPLLSDTIDVRRDHLLVRGTSSIYRVLSADAASQEGLNPSAIVIDELHRHGRRDLYDTLRQGSIGAAREQPMLVTITNAGSDPQSICGEVYSRGKANVDPKLFYYVPELRDEYLDRPEAWKMVNPAPWITDEALLHQYQTSPRFVFQRFRLNRWTAADELWLPPDAWPACARPEVKLRPGEPIVVTLDASQNRDTTAVSWGALRGDEIVTRSRSWAVKNADPAKPQKPAHVLVETPTVELEMIEGFVRDLARVFDVSMVRYDPWRFERSAELLRAEGVKCEQFPQTNERMCPASQAMYDRIVASTLLHAGDEMVEKQVLGAAVKDTGRGWRLSKKEGRANDIAITLAMLVGHFDGDRPPPPRKPSVERML